jgi:competence protein ComEA
VEPSSAPWRVLEDPEPAGPSPEPVSHPVPWAALAVALAIGFAALGAFLLASRSEPVITVDGAAGDVAGALDAGAPTGRASDAPGGLLVVEVGGAVNHPGVYRLAPGSRIGDAITAAGGFGPRVDATAADSRLNLAAVLHDGDEVHVPSRDETSMPPAPGGPDPAGGGTRPSGLIDLNSASAEQLDTLPGIGPATAAKIIAAREEQRFRTVDELLARKVVGQSTLDKIRSLVSVGP